MMYICMHVLLPSVNSGPCGLKRMLMAATVLEIVFTHPSARRQSRATALVLHASTIADVRDDEMYLDAQGQAMGIYERAGYIHRTDVEKTSEVMYPMMRPKRTRG